MKKLYFCIILIHALVFSLLGQTSSLVYLNEEGKIIYKEDSKGNKIPDPDLYLLVR